jgi:ABC-type multidrug transport system ATPase subunit
VAGGATILLTTQYLEEADELADRIALLDHGRLVAEGTPDELKRRIPRRPHPPPVRLPGRARVGRPRPR